MRRCRTRRRSRPLSRKPIRIVVPSSPGGGLDFTARAVGQKLTAAWGQTVVVDNRPGAGGTIGPDLVAKSAPDGYTLLIISASFAVNPSVYPKLPYDSVKDFAPVVQATAQPQVLVVHPSVPARSAKELVALAKAKPGQLNYASPGGGTLSQLAFELFKFHGGHRHRARAVQGRRPVDERDRGRRNAGVVQQHTSPRSRISRAAVCAPLPPPACAGRRRCPTSRP